MRLSIVSVLRRTEHVLSIISRLRRTEHALSIISRLRRTEHALVIPVLKRCRQVSQTGLTVKVPGLSQQTKECLKNSTQCCVLTFTVVCMHTQVREHTHTHTDMFQTQK